MLTLAMVTLLGGCISATKQAPTTVPILYNTTFPGAPAPTMLGKAGESLEVFGILYNARTNAEDPQRQMLVCSDPSAPFRRTWLRLVEPVQKLPACDAEFVDLWKRFVEPYRMRGRLVVHHSDGSDVYRLIATQAKPLTIGSHVTAACVQTLQNRWGEMSDLIANIPWKWSQRYVKLGEFVKLIEPRLLAMSRDGSELLYQCAEGTFLLPVPAESTARIYCLYDLEIQAVMRIYVESRTQALD